MRLRRQSFSRSSFSKVVYAVFVGSILFDLATTILCFQVSGFTETNPLYRIFGAWAFPIVYLVDGGLLLFVEWLRKHIWWSPIILFVLILAYINACVTNLNLLLGG